MDTLKVCISVYGNVWKAYYAAAECVFIEANDALPEWGCFIERFDKTPTGYIFVHKDAGAAL